MNLVIGATGQLGTAVVRKLVRDGRPVRAFVRTASRYQHLEGPGVELAFGDLRDPASIDAACDGVDTVLATASAIAPPPGGGGLKEVDDRGYTSLIEACARHGVSQFIFASVPVTPNDRKVPVFRIKRITERRIEASGVPYTIFRLAMFADVWPAMLGTSLPQRGAEAPFTDRPFWFLRSFRRSTGTMIEDKGTATLPGRGDTPATFITIDDAASLMVAAIGNPAAMYHVLDIGGPEILTFDQVAQTLGRVLDRPVRTRNVPPAVFRVMATLLRPFSLEASAVMAMNWSAARGDIEPADPEQSRETAAALGVELTSLEAFLRDRAAIDVASRDVEAMPAGTVRDAPV